MKKTISAICGNRWPRIMCPTWAAAYCNRTLPQFRAIPEYAALIKKNHGEEEVDKFQLDAMLDEVFPR